MNRLEYDPYIWEGRMSETLIKLSHLAQFIVLSNRALLSGGIED